MADEKDKKTLSYEPDIKYTEDYSSQYKGRDMPDREEDEVDDYEDIYDDLFMQSIQDNIDVLVELIPNLSVDLQTVVNQVFKPIFNDWYKNLKKKRYPSRIPDPDEPIIKKPIGEEDDPWNPIPPTWDPPTPGPTPGPGEDPWEPQPPDNLYPEHDDPEIFIPDIDDPIIGQPIHRPIITFPGDDDGIFDPGSPFEVIYEPMDPIQIIDLEFTKNMAELYYFYTDRLKSTLGQYYLTLYNASVTSREWQEENSKINKVDTVKFMMDGLSKEDAKTAPDLKHLADVAVRYDVNAYLKMSFVSNTFPVESTLYHMKNVKAAQELRTRYEKEKLVGDGTDINSKSDRILYTSREAYNKKYDTAYINLYKYLNSYVDALTDALKTQMTSITAKETLIKKGGVDKK